MEFEYDFTTTFKRTLSDSEALFFEQVIGYACKGSLRLAESPSFTWKKNNSAVKVYADTTKSYSDDISFLFGEFWENVETYLNEGSPKYKRALRGKPAGFQLIPAHETMSYRVIKSITLDIEELIQEGSESGESKAITIEIPAEVKEFTVTFKL